MFAGDVEQLLKPLAKSRGLLVIWATGVFEPNSPPNKNYRTPDLVVVDPQYLSARGIEGRTEIVIEILSPDDESREKLGFYAMCEVQEVWILDPVTRAHEVYVLRAGTFFAVASDRAGVTSAPLLGLSLQAVDGPKLRVTWADGSADI
jgi:Uma2 family endonuclease